MDPAKCFLRCLLRCMGGMCLAVLLWLPTWAGAQGHETPGDQGPSVAWASGQLDKLARHPTWLRLLHVAPGESQSQVRSAAFFLAPEGVAATPDQELKADLLAWTTNWEQPDLHPRCRFPARYAWLAGQLNLPGYLPRDRRCHRLEEWARFDHLRSISLLLVSGYFGNPASTFGHALLKFNTDDGAATGGKTDISVNFGAAVPPNEWTLLYIFRGLTGRYQSGFSDKPFYADDLIYGHSEFRDIWSYELALTPVQRDFLVMHLFEIAGMNFDYYFLTRNCALRLAEMIQLATDRPVVRSATAWYLPVELFSSLHELDVPGGRMLQASPRFIPSAERRLLHDLSQLPPEQMDTLRKVLEEGTDTLDIQLNSHDAEAQLNILDGLLAYQEYRIAAQAGDDSTELRSNKDRILLERLRRPPRASQQTPVPDEPSPAYGHSPMGIGLSGVRLPGGTGAVDVQWSPVQYEAAGFHGLNPNELVLMETVARLRADHSIRLQQLDFIRLRKLNSMPLDLPGLSRWSWQTRLSLDPAHDTESSAHRLHFSFGIGRAAQYQGWVVHALLVAHAQTGAMPLGWGSQLGADAQKGGWGFSAKWATQQRFRTSGLEQHTELLMARRVEKDAAWRLSWARDSGQGSQARLGWQRYW